MPGIGDIIGVEHRLLVDLAAGDRRPRSTAWISRQACWAYSMNGVSSIRTPEVASRSSISLDSSSSLVSRSCVCLSWPPLSRASAAKVERPLFTLSTLGWMRLVDWAMPSVWRSTRATMSATSRTVSLIRVKRACATRLLLDAGLDLGGDRLGLAGQRGDGAGDLAGRGAGVVGELLHLGGDDREAAARLAGARRLDGGVEREHVGLAGDGLDRWRRRSAPGSSPRRSRPCGRPAGRRGR